MQETQYPALTGEAAGCPLASERHQLGGASAKPKPGWLAAYWLLYMPRASGGGAHAQSLAQLGRRGSLGMERGSAAAGEEREEASQSATGSETAWGFRSKFRMGSEGLGDRLPPGPPAKVGAEDFL